MSATTKTLLAAACVAVAAFLMAFATDLTGSDPDPTTTTTTEEPTTGTTPTTAPTTTTTVDPSGEPVGGDPNNPTYVRAGFPSDANTGPENRGIEEDALPPCPGHPASGSWTITAAGTIIEDCVISTVLRVSAPNVWLRGVVVRANANLVVDNQSTGLVIEDSILRPNNPAASYTNAPSGESCGAGVAQGNYELYRSEVWGCADGVKVANTVVLEDNFFHDYDKTCAGGSCTHNDSWQKNDNTDLASLTVVGNAFYHHPCRGNGDGEGASNRHWQAKNTTTATVDIRGNFFYGSHGVVNDDGSGSGVSGQVSGNVLAGTPTSGPFSPQVGDVFTVGSHWSGVSFAGNSFENGSPLPANGDLQASYDCDLMPVGG